ncbi:MAG: sensor histidine kinase [Candidatus Hodarchaeota archaeon]
MSFALMKDIVLVILGFAFLLLISGVLYKYSVSSKFKLWGAGWSFFSIGGALALLRSDVVTQTVDILAIIAIVTSALLILDGTRGKTNLTSRLPVYFVGISTSIIWSSICLAFSWHVIVLYTPVQFILAYSCFITFNELRMMKADVGISGVVCMTTFFIWGLSALFYPLLLLSGISYLAAFVQAVAVILVGASTMSFYIRLTTHIMRTQYEISELMSLTLRHDIRNFVQTASLALGIHQNGIERNPALDIATEAMNDAIKFCENMREISISTLHLRPTLIPVQIKPLINNAIRRVQREYGLPEKHFQVTVPDNLVVHSNQLAEELLWNILDNSIKHGGTRVALRCESYGNGHSILIIRDDAGGLPEDVKNFLNSKRSFWSSKVPKFGLGVPLIKGLSEISDVSLKVSNIVEDSQIIGTEYEVIFLRCNS